MIEIKAPKRLSKSDLFRKPTSAEDCKTEIELGTRVISDEDGSLLLATKQIQLSQDLAALLKTIKFPGGSRLSGIASGESLTFGFSPKKPAQISCQTCRISASTRDYPALAGQLFALARKTFEVMQEVASERATETEVAASHISKEWRIPGTPWTSIIVNRNNPLRYHYDAGNSKGAWSAMLYVGSGVEGGGLLFPEYDFKMPFKDGLLSFFSGQSELHGVEPIKILTEKAYRYSIVFYTLEQMKNCKSMKDELRDAQVRRTKTELKRARGELAVQKKYKK